MITDKTRQAIRERAGGYCEYYQSPEVIGISMHIDHIVPKAANGSDELDNLCWACDHCNQAKHDFQQGTDPQTNEETDLFNPRQDAWENHFDYSDDFTQIAGITVKGRATIERLRMNTHKRQIARQLWH